MATVMGNGSWGVDGGVDVCMDMDVCTGDGVDTRLLLACMTGLVQPGPRAQRKSSCCRRHARRCACSCLSRQLRKEVLGL